MDKACFPIQDWQYRALTQDEMISVMLSTGNIIKFVNENFGPSKDIKDRLSPGNIIKFVNENFGPSKDIKDRLSPGIKYVNELLKMFSSMNSTDTGPKDQAKRDFKRIWVNELDGWKQMLPLIDKEIIQSARTPIFIARDSLGILEYRSLMSQIIGQEVPEHHVVYIPGSPENTPKNRRQADGIIDGISNNGFMMQVTAWDKDENSEDVSDADFRKTATDKYLGIAKQFIIDTYDKKEGYYFKKLYFDLVQQYNGNLPNFLLVDTQGTGKTILLLKVALETIAELNGNKIDVDVLLGRTQGRFFDVPSITRKYKYENTDHFADLKWPFVFSGVDNEVHFDCVASSGDWLQLLWRSMNFYNAAVQERIKELNSST